MALPGEQRHHPATSCGLTQSAGFRVRSRHQTVIASSQRRLRCYRMAATTTAVMPRGVPQPTSRSRLPLPLAAHRGPPILQLWRHTWAIRRTCLSGLRRSLPSLRATRHALRGGVSIGGAVREAFRAAAPHVAERRLRPEILCDESCCDEGSDAQFLETPCGESRAICGGGSTTAAMPWKTPPLARPSRKDEFEKEDNPVSREYERVESSQKTRFGLNPPSSLLPPQPLTGYIRFFGHVRCDARSLLFDCSWAWRIMYSQ